MRLGAMFLLLVLVVMGAFAVLNWGVFVAPTTLSLGLTEVQPPMALVMMGMLVFLLALFMHSTLDLQTTDMLDNRSHAKELQANRRLADQAEASRFTELRNFLETELRGQAMTQQDAQRALMARVEQLEQRVQQMIEQSGNSLAASLGEVDDRLRRQLSGSGDASRG